MALISLTSGIGCGAEEIGRSVAEKLKLEFYDDRRIAEEAIKQGISPKDLSGFDEKAPGLLNRLFGQKPEIYLNLMHSLLYQISSGGKAVLLGHGAPWLLQDFGCALHVCIYASNASRIQRLVDRHGLSTGAAEKLIQKSDSERSGFFQYAFQMDWNDSSLFDLKINRDKLDKDLAVGIIIEAAQSEGIKACNLTALDAMERMSLAKRVEAALLRSKISLRELNIEVIERGVVLVSGWLSPFVSKTGLQEVVRGVRGVSEVKLDISAVPRPHI
jgi:CMP/dCMP kinase